MAERTTDGIGLGRGGRWLLAGLAIVVTAGCHPFDDLMGGIFGRTMRTQPSLDPYDAPQPPPEGAVPFAAGNFPAGPYQVNLGQPEGTPIPEPVTPAQLLQALADPDAFPGVTGLENPVEPTAASLERGEEVYLRACSPCHGAVGDGAGPVTEAAPAFARSLLSDEAMALNASYIYSIIRAGRGAMPAYGHQIAHYDRWHVTNYVLQLQGRLGEAQNEAAPDAPPEEN